MRQRERVLHQSALLLIRSKLLTEHTSIQKYVYQQNYSVYHNLRYKERNTCNLNFILHKCIKILHNTQCVYDSILQYTVGIYKMQKKHFVHRVMLVLSVCMFWRVTWSYEGVCILYGETVKVQDNSRPDSGGHFQRIGSICVVQSGPRPISQCKYVAK